MRGTLVLAALAAGVVGAGLFVTRATSLPDDTLAGITGEAARGEPVFIAAGCASCHTAPDAPEDAALVLAGGQRFESEFGTFIAPNISSDPSAGIGDWSQEAFASAVMRGVSPDGAHYYPAFPYTAYALMQPQDVADLWAYMQTLPASPETSQAHEIGFPFNIRATLGAWKMLYLDDAWVMSDATVADGSDDLARGRYLVEALAHCGECHTPRNALGALDRDAWMAGAPNPSGTGRIPPLTPDALDWSAGDIAYYLESGFTPDFDSAGGHMVAVIRNFAQLPADDRTAVASYLKALPAAADR